MIRGLIFDMDGVIVDSNRVHRDAWIEFNLRHGLTTDEAMLSRMYGKRNDEIIGDFFGTHLTAEEVFDYGAAKEALFREMIGSQVIESMVPGVRQFLLKHKDFLAAVATNAEAANANFVLDRLDLRSLFQVVIDGHQVTHPKPHPEIYLRAAESLALSPDECLVFEDSYAGVEAGLAAGMRVVGIRTTHEELPGTIFTVADFTDPAIDSWLQQSRKAHHS